MLPVYFHIIGTEEDPGYPTRPRLMFVGEVRDGQTMVGRVEMTPDGHLRWKWVRLHLIFSYYVVPFNSPTNLFRYAVRAVKLFGGIVYSSRTYWPSLIVASSSCNGIQVGGVRSSYGVLGSWTTFFHEHLDPVGMFCSPICLFF